MRGRPLAFLAMVLIGWVAARFLLLMPDETIRPLTLVSKDMIATSAQARPFPNPVAASPLSSDRNANAKFFLVPSATARGESGGRVASQIVSATAAIAEGSAGQLPPPVLSIVAPPGLPPIVPLRASPPRWTASAWAIARDGGGGSLLSPLLGGAQAGLRIAYRLDDAGRAAMFARVNTPLNGGPAELAGGLQARPTRAPITVYAEVRAIRGDAAPAVGVFGGGAIALPHDFRLEGYGQAGVIRRDGVSGFGDGQLRLVQVIDRIEIGAGAWAAAQRGASRLDIGPSLSVPIAADPLALRVTIDWRQRVAGNARPASGPAVSLGADF